LSGHFIRGLQNTARAEDFSRISLFGYVRSQYSLRSRARRRRRQFVAGFTSTGLSLEVTAANVASAVIRVGGESIDLKALGMNPLIVPVGTPAPQAGLPDVFLPLFSIGSVAVATPTVSSVVAYNSFASFAAKLPARLADAGSALQQLVASGTYNRGSNTFTATTIDVVN